MARRKTHPGSIQPRGDGYRVRLHVAGEMHRFQINSVTMAEAQAFAIEKQEELKREAGRRSVGLPGRISFSGLLKRFDDHELPGLAENTRKSYRSSFKFFRWFFVERMGNPTIEKIRPGHIREYLTWRRSTSPKARAAVSPLTVARDRRVLHRLFAFAEDVELRDGNPVRTVSAPVGDERTPILLSDEQLDGLLRRLDHNPMSWMYVVLLADTGLRAGSEALWLRWEDLDLQEGFVHVRSGRDGHRTKSGKSRWVPVTERLREALQEHAASSRER